VINVKSKAHHRMPGPTRSIFEPLEGRQLMSGGGLDLTFGKNGIAQLPEASRMTAADVAVQPGGKTVVAGHHWWRANGNTYSMFAVARFNVDGTVDKTFRNKGRISTSITSIGSHGDARARAVAIVGGDYNGGDWGFAVARLNPNGSLDKSFDGDGKRTIAMGRE
jgi:uncharacterized delta-60 repeat protein